MNPDDDSPLDVAAWMRDQAPTLVEAEAADTWARGRARQPRPITDLMAEGSPLQTFLSAPDEPDEGLDRAARRQFWEDRRAAEAAAVEAVTDATEDHTHLARAYELADANDLMGAAIGRATRAKAQADEDEANGITKAPTTGPDNRPIGRW